MAQPLINAPRDLLLSTVTGDIVITGGALQWTSGQAAIGQSCRIAMQLFQGEWFLNLSLGIPYWQSILGQKPAVAIAAARIAFNAALLGVDGVVKVTKLNVTFDSTTRAMSVDWQVTTIFGDTPADTLVLAAAGGS